MIYIERTIVINKNTATIEEPIVLYKGDRNVELQFSIKNSPLKYKTGLTATYGQLVIKRPKAEAIFSTCERLSNGKVIFCITSEMIDELIELGNYSFQIRLFNEDQTSRASLPPVEAGIIIKEPICEEEEGAFLGVVDFTRAATGESLDVFDQEGDYNKTIWAAGDTITDAKLNKVENAIDYLFIENANNAANISEKADVEHTHDEYLTEHQDISGKADIGHTHDEYVTESELSSKGYLTEHQSLENYALKTEIPSIDGLVSKTYVDSEVAKKADEDHIHNQYLTQHQNISHLATKAEIPAIPTNVSAFNNDAGYLTQHQSLESYATKTYVDNKLGGITRIEVVDELPGTEETGVLYIVKGK